jgi:protein-disulfide isomerase
LAKKKNAPTGAQNMKMFYGILVLVAVLGIAGILYARNQSAGMSTEPLDLTQISDANELLRQARGETLGRPDAPVQIHVFSDFMCPACGHWAGQIESQLKLEFIDPGLVQLTYYDFPLGGSFRYSFVASRAARCAGDQGRFWEYHDRLFATQQSWSYASDVPTSQFIQIARDVGVEPRAFEACLRSDAHAEVVTANRMLGETLGVSGTPTVFLNGRQLREWSDYGAVRSAIQAAGGV